MNKLEKIFNKEKNIIIGALHFPPLLGYKDFPGFDIALENALRDLDAFTKGGADAVIFENNYDLPHKIKVDSAVAASMTFLGEKLKQASKIPLGISVLWNDYETALSIARILDLQFIRIPVFVDKVKTDYGIIQGDAEEVIRYRELIGVQDVALFTDIHVKHAELLSDYSIVESAQKAIATGSDALIITGKWTGDAPAMAELHNLRSQIDKFPLLIGSGLNKENIKDLFDYTNGAIVSTSVKTGVGKSHKINVKSYKQRIDSVKVRELINGLN